MQTRQPRSRCTADVEVQTVTGEHDASGRNVELGAKTLEDFSLGIDNVEFGAQDCSVDRRTQHRSPERPLRGLATGGVYSEIGKQRVRPVVVAH